MAYTKYSLTPANNNATPPDGAPEGMLPSAVNDTMRDMMAQIRDVGDGIRDGTYTMTAPKITGGTITGSTINNSAIGGTTAAAGAFTTLSASGAVTFSNATVVSGSLTANTFSSSGATITGGSINSTAIGGTTAAAGKFTTLEATGATTFSGATVVSASLTANTFSSSGATITGGSVTGITDLAIADGGTGASTAAGARTNLGLDGFVNMKNRIINGAMVIDQRNAGASVSIDGTFPYITDRWQVQDFTDGVVSAQQVTDAPSGFINSLKVTVTTADSSLGSNQLSRVQQPIEGLNIADLGWGTADAKTVTLSFWVKSSVTGTFGGSLINGGNTRSYPFTYSISSANTWEYKTVTVAGDTTGTWLTTNGIGIQVNLSLAAGSSFLGTAGAWAGADYRGATGQTNLLATLNATWFVTGVQLEVGSTATSFDYRPYGTELQLCQRYAIVYGREQAYSQIGGTGFAVSTTSVDIGVTVPVQMRTVPTVSSSGNFQISDGAAATSATAVSIVTAQNNLLVVSLRGSVASGLTTYRPYRLETANSLTAYVLLSAEL